jgi:hypothetical protein
MLSYEAVLNDPDVQRTFGFYNISYKPNDKVDHGLDHAKRVAHYCQGLGQMLGLNKEQIEILRVAAILHDIGVSSSGKDEHNIRSAEWVSGWLSEKKRLDPTYKKELINLVRNHHKGNASLVMCVLVFAEKLDICHQRVLPAGMHFAGVRQYAHLRNVKCRIHQNTFEVHWTSDGRLNLMELNEHYYIPKVFAATHNIAKQLGLKSKMFIDNAEWIWSAKKLVYNV